MEKLCYLNYSKVYVDEQDNKYRLSYGYKKHESYRGYEIKESYSLVD